MAGWRHLDTLPQYVPDRLKPLLKPAYPLYQEALHRWFRLLPERTIRTPWGPRIRVDPANFVERGLAQGTFEKNVIEFFENELIGETSVFVDVGANVGFYSLLYAFESEPASTVHAFEPLPENVERFEQNIQQNDINSVSIHQVALSDEEGTASLSVSERHPGEATLSNEPKSATSDRKVHVRQRKFDDVVHSIDDPELVKIDVEGAECRVIEGAINYLVDQTPKLLLEMHPGLLEGFGDSPADIRDLLVEAGYEHVINIAAGTKYQIGSFEDIDVATHSNLYVE